MDGGRGMTVHNGIAARIAAYVAAHPGCTRAEILEACGLDMRDAMPTYARKSGLIHAAGPRGSARYFPTADTAAAADASIRSMVEATRKAKKAAAHVRDNLRKIAKRQAAGKRSIPSLQRVRLDPGVTLAPDVRITIAPALKDRWAA